MTNPAGKEAEAYDLIRSIAASDPEGTIDYGSGSEQTGSHGAARKS